MIASRARSADQRARYLTLSPPLDGVGRRGSRTPEAPPPRFGDAPPARLSSSVSF
jgi:hypothetical protein